MTIEEIEKWQGTIKPSFSIIFFTIFLTQIPLYLFSQGNWTQKTNFGGSPRWGAVGFSIAGKGYMAMGYDGANHNDLWEWDQVTNTWTQKASCPGAPRRACSGFAIGSKGYIWAGYNGSFFNDLWEWNQATNSWIQKATIPASARYGSACFVIGDKGYIACGNGGNLNGPYFNDLWEWNQLTDSWTQRADYPGGKNTV